MIKLSLSLNLFIFVGHEHHGGGCGGGGGGGEGEGAERERMGFNSLGQQHTSMKEGAGKIKTTNTQLVLVKLQYMYYVLHTSS